MTLRRKTLLVITLTLVVLIVLLYLILRTLLMGSFSSLEQQVSLRDLSRAESSLQDHSASMERAIRDWSTWDETYTFVQGGNPTYIDSNLDDNTFTSVDVNLMMFVNNANEIVYSKAVAIESDWPSTLPSQIEAYARSNADFFRLMSSVPTAGLVVIDGEPLLVASRPILHSDESGPKAGTLIWGRYEGKQELEELSQTLRLSVDLHGLNAPNLSTEELAAQAALSSTTPRVITPTNETTIHGYTLLDDIYGQPALVLKTTADRAIYEQGQASLIYFIAALVVVGIVFAIVVLLLLERLMLAPLSHLSRRVRQIGVLDDFSVRLPVIGDDEFTYLASALNTMLNLVAQSRAALQRERNLLRLLIDTVPANVYIKDAQSRFVDANLETALQMGVKTSNDLIGKTDFDFFNGELAGQYLANEQAIIQSGQPVRNIEEPSFDYRTQRENWLLTTEVPILDEHGQVTGLVGVSLDITERKQAEQQIAQERDLLRTLIDQLPDYIFVKDADGHFVNSNAAHNRIAHVKQAEELRGKFPSDVFPLQLAAQFEADDQQVIDSGQALVNVERTSLDAEGQERTVLTTKVPLYDASGKVTGLVGISRDITERKQAERALQAKDDAERRFQASLKALYEITIELTQIDQLDDFYRRVVELALERMGFDRFALLLYDAENSRLIGTYGTDAQGKLVAEHQIQFEPETLTSIMKRTLETREGFALNEHTPLFSNREPIGFGWNAVALLRNGEHNLGWLAADNGVQHQPVSKPLLDILALYAQTVGTLLGRKRAEQALRENEAKLQTFFEVLPVGVSVLNEDDQILEMNPALERILGTSLDGLRNGAYRSRKYISSDGQPMERSELPSARARSEQQTIHDVEIGVVKEDETTVWTSVSATPLPGTSSGLLLVTADITERKRIEQALEEERRLLHTLIDTLPDYIYIKDRESRFVIGNTATALSLGAATPDDIVGKTDFDFHPPELAARFFAEEQALFQSGKPLLNQEERVIDQRTGEWQILLSTNVPLYDHQGQITGLVGVNRDITERKLAEEQAFALAAEQQRGKLMRAFITDVSHDFRTPLTIIGTSAFLIGKTTDSAKLTQHRERIEEQMSRLRLLLDNFVQLAHLDEQASLLPAQSADLDKLVKTILEQSQREVAAKHQQLEYRCETYPTLVLGDPAALSQAITQVVDNALHYTPDEGKVMLHLYRDGENLVLEIADSGIGIRANDLPHIFESFYRVDSARSTTTGGAGLGLTIAKRIIELMKGRIEAASEFGTGSVFKIYLPIHP